MMKHMNGLKAIVIMALLIIFNEGQALKMFRILKMRNISS
jgi:hypothetical protein